MEFLIFVILLFIVIAIIWIPCAFFAKFGNYTNTGTPNTYLAKEAARADLERSIVAAQWRYDNVWKKRSDK